MPRKRNSPWNCQSGGKQCRGIKSNSLYVMCREGFQPPDFPCEHLREKIRQCRDIKRARAGRQMPFLSGSEAAGLFPENQLSPKTYDQGDASG